MPRGVNIEGLRDSLSEGRWLFIVRILHYFNGALANFGLLGKRSSIESGVKACVCINRTVERAVAVL